MYCIATSPTETTPTFYNKILTHLGDGRPSGLWNSTSISALSCTQLTPNTKYNTSTHYTTKHSHLNKHACQTLQIPGSNPLRRPNLAHPHNTKLPPQNSLHRIAKHQSPCIQSTCPTITRIRALCMGSTPRQVEECVWGSTEPGRTIFYKPMTQYCCREIICVYNYIKNNVCVWYWINGTEDTCYDWG